MKFSMCSVRIHSGLFKMVFEAVLIENYAGLQAGAWSFWHTRRLEGRRNPRNECVHDACGVFFSRSGRTGLWDPNL